MGLILISPILLNRYSTNTPVILEFKLGTSTDVINTAMKEAFDKYIALHPDKSGAQLTITDVVSSYYYIFSGFFKIKLIGYQAQIVPILLVVGLSVNLEKLFKKIIPDIFALILVPCLTVFIST